ncbi:MAG: SDR family oxidoreductase [Trueperaceae bacterium]|nr:SDR family oxidoreductase [Trueperaceae bacterium]
MPVHIRLARAGAYVNAADNDLASAEETVAHIARRAVMLDLAVDVLDDTGLVAMIKGVKARHGRVDACIATWGWAKAVPPRIRRRCRMAGMSNANLTSLHVQAPAYCR